MAHGLGYRIIAGPSMLDILMGFSKRHMHRQKDVIAPVFTIKYELGMELEVKLLLDSIEWDGPTTLTLTGVAAYLGDKKQEPITKRARLSYHLAKRRGSLLILD